MILPRSTLGSAVAVLTLTLLGTVAIPAANFRRGDANQDGKADISDAVATLGNLFLGTSLPDCDDALDINDDGGVDISDPVTLLNFLFSGGKAPSAPFPDCGPDETADVLDCAESAQCGEPCIDQEALTIAIETQVPGELCAPVDTVLNLSTFIATVCPSGSAMPCGPDQAPGCPIQLTSVVGTLLLAESKLSVHIEGVANDLPIVVNSGISTTTCSVDAAFAGDAVSTLELAPNGDGSFTVTAVGDPTLEDADVSLTATGGFICSLLEASQDLFKQQILDQLAVGIADIGDQIRAEVVGKRVCGG